MLSLIERGLKPVAQLAENRTHGDRLRYLAGCRCQDCRRANSAYESARKKARLEGDWNGIVSASSARAHLLKLSEEGIGRRAVGAATDLADSVLFDIRSGRKANIRARTERLILAVSKEMASDGALIPALSSWYLIHKLIKQGYTKAQISKLMGNNGRALQIGKAQVTVRNAYTIRRVYQQLKDIGFKTGANRKTTYALPHGTTSPKPGVLVHRMGD